MTTSASPWLRPFLGGKIPLLVKLLFTAFLGVMVPFYWSTYGPTNFLYFCDVALVLTLVSVWTEHTLPAGMAAVGILVPQMLWAIDFAAGLLGTRITGMTAYMFDPRKPLFTRGLSLFHGWLPFFLLYLTWRLGYDRRALVRWTLLAWALMLVCYFLMPAPPAPADNPNLPVNINYVYGPSDEGPQQQLPPLGWLAFVMIGFPVVFFLPAHLVLRALFRNPAAQRTGAVPGEKEPSEPRPRVWA